MFGAVDSQDAGGDGHLPAVPEAKDEASLEAETAGAECEGDISATNPAIGPIAGVESTAQIMVTGTISARSDTNTDEMDDNTELELDGEASILHSRGTRLLDPEPAEEDEVEALEAVEI